MTDALTTRISAAAALTGHAVETLLAHLGDVAKPLRSVAIHTNADVDSIAVSIAVPDDEWLARRMANLANAISASTALASVAMARRGALRAERGIGRQGRPARGLAGVFSALSSTVASTLAADLTVADAAGIPAPVRDTLAARLRLLGADVAATTGPSAPDRTLRTVVYSGPPDATTSVELGHVAPPDLVDRVASASAAAAISLEELARLRALTEALGGTPSVRVTATQSEVLPGFTLSYANLSLDDVLVLAGQFSDAGVQRVQPFLEAIGAGTVDADITFGDRVLGPLWLTIRL